MITDVNDFEYKESRWQDLYSFLKKEGYDVYSPGQHVGDCTSAYVVVKNSISSRVFHLSTNADIYVILVYVPEKSYSTLEVMIESIKKSMKKIYPLFKEYGQQTEAFYDSEVKGYTASILYSNYKKIDL